MRFRSGKKPETEGKFTPKLRGPNPEVEHEVSAQENPVSVQPVEPEDPQKTGSSEPARRQVLEKNVTEGKAKQHPETVAGQHATGSFTNKSRRAG
jgi:hypothetical protein